MTIIQCSQTYVTHLNVDGTLEPPEQGRIDPDQFPLIVRGEFGEFLTDEEKVVGESAQKYRRFYFHQVILYIAFFFLQKRRISLCWVTWCVVSPLTSHTCRRTVRTGARLQSRQSMIASPGPYGTLGSLGGNGRSCGGMRSWEEKKLRLKHSSLPCIILFHSWVHAFIFQ